MDRRIWLRTLAGTPLVLGVIILPTPQAQADFGLCNYPGVGVGAKVLGGFGGSCDYPTEINGSHFHCEIGGFSLGGGAGLSGSDSGLSANLGVTGVLGAGGVSCTWRCPDGVMAPAPNPPGAWKDYLVPMDSTNFCRDHMEPNGFWSEPVLPTEGVPEQPQPPQIAPGTPNP